MKIVYATTNPGKFAEVSKIFLSRGVDLHSPAEFSVSKEVEETGKTLEENAALKAEAYRDLLPSGCLVLGDDTGIEIEALGGEPGIKVRRWKGYKMTDAEIREYCLERLRDVRAGNRQAHFRTVIAVAGRGIKTKIFEGKLDGEIVLDPPPQTIEGFPFEPLFYIPEYGKLLADIHRMPDSEQELFTTHRHRAVNAALPYLKELAG